MAFTFVSATLKLLKFVLISTDREWTCNEDAFDWRPWLPWRLTGMTQWYQNIWGFSCYGDSWLAPCVKEIRSGALQV